jgi:hypothetical protein
MAVRHKARGSKGTLSEPLTRWRDALWPPRSDPAGREDQDASRCRLIALRREPGGGLVVMPDIFMTQHRVPIVLAAARNNVPAVAYQSALAREGGLLSYGPDVVDIFRRAASYVDRILRGEKPGAYTFSSRPNSNSSSTSRPPRRSASQSRKRC